MLFAALTISASRFNGARLDLPFKASKMNPDKQALAFFMN
jgi:hypothetical protein